MIGGGKNLGAASVYSRMFVLFLLCAAVFMSFMAPAAGAGTYLSSAHGSGTAGVDRSSIDSKYATYAKGNCGHCHEQHASLQGAEPNPVSGAASPALGFDRQPSFCVRCHNGTIVLKDIASQLNKTYGHGPMMTTYPERHTLSKLEAGQNGLPFRGTSRHVECADCHEPHSVQNTLHVYNTSAPANNNLVSGVIAGVWGVEPNSEPLWLSASTTYTELKPAQKEYQICFKCHSYYALAASNGVSTLPPGPSGQLVTDQGMEFSKNNRSAHPVRVGLNSQTGSVSPRSLTTAQMKSPWNSAAGIGVQTMYCSDCHGNDASSPVGPHGSSNKYMIKDATNTEWPKSSISGQLWSLKNIKDNSYSWSTRLLCAKCHVLFSGGNFKNDVHNDGHHQENGRYCVHCHVVVPHGSKRGRLIAYATDPAPYSYPNVTVIRGFKKSAASPNGYSKKNCYFPNGNGCSDHDSNDGGYDP